MKAARQDIILQILEKEKKIVASKLSERLKVSEDTIRRDLNELANQGLIRRVHSGAIRVGPAITDFNVRQDLNINEKVKLAKKAVHLIKENSVILIDGGTTNYELVKLIPKDLKCTVVSNNIPILHLLSVYQNVEVIGLGGRLYKNSLVLIGAETIRELEAIRPDIYFMGVAHVDSEVGVTIPGLDECYTKQKMAQVSNEVAILVTEEKLETRSNFVVSSLKDINYIFTSKDI